MFKKLVPLNRDRHARTRIQDARHFGFAAGLHVTHLTVPEFPRAAPLYPIVFVEHGDAFLPMALVGLLEGENLFVDADGRWDAGYIPAVVRRYPFALATTSAQGQYTVCIDEDSPLVGEAEGQALFDSRGEPTAVVENVKRYLAELQQMDEQTQQFSAWLQAHNMLVPLSISLREQGSVRQIAGCYQVNEERLNTLSDPLFLALRSQRFLPAVYAHLLSLAQVDRLVALRATRQAQQGRAGDA